MWLTLDIGNSTAKGGLYDGAALRQAFQIALDHASTAAAWKQALANVLADEQVDRIGVASVVPTVTPAAVGALETLTGIRPERIHAAMRLPFTLRYTSPETLGIDRLAAAAAAWLRYGRGTSDDAGHGVVAIDAGTAVTLDVVSRTGVYEGGTIGPGPALMLQSLHEGTALLPDVPLEMPDQAIGRSTQEALQSGIVGGFIEGVRGLLERVHTALDDAPVVIATGGWSPLLARHITAIDELVPHLVLDGIREIMVLNPPEGSP